jgi:tRNA nucleotidyltransferase/poly(A) polymerase
MQPRELANTVCEALQNAGFQAFLVGGCVRDILLGRACGLRRSDQRDSG